MISTCKTINKASLYNILTAITTYKLPKNSIFLKSGVLIFTLLLILTGGIIHRASM